MKPLYIFLIISFFLNKNLAGFGNLRGLKSDITRADTLNILHYDIHLDIMNFSAEQIKGYTEVSITPRVNNLSTIALDLLKLKIDLFS